MSNTKDLNQQTPNCIKCIYYYVTWDKINPKGCKYFGFKGPYIPSVYVKMSSGNECKAFKSK